MDAGTSPASSTQVRPVGLLGSSSSLLIVESQLCLLGVSELSVDEVSGEKLGNFGDLVAVELNRSRLFALLAILSPNSDD